MTAPPSDVNPPGGNRADGEKETRCKSRALLGGWTMHIVPGRDGGSRFLLLKWDRSIELPDLGAFHEFLDRALGDRMRRGAP